MDVDHRLQRAVQQFWIARSKQQEKQIQSGVIDAGTRGAVTGGTQMGGLEVLVADVLIEAGFDQSEIQTRTSLQLPGYYRPEKKWDLIVVSKRQLVCVLEFKSQVGPSFGNNFNNRSEEAIGSATDIWRAYREGRFGNSPEPFLGYIFLLEDCAAVKRPVGHKEPYFPVDPAFIGASYSKRYELLCRRLVHDRLYRSACLILTSRDSEAGLTQPAADLTFQRLVAGLRGHVLAFRESGI